MSEPVKMGNLLTKLILDNRCEKCGRRYPHINCKWCQRCVEIYKRKQKMTPARIDKTVIQLVEPLYANATLDDIEPAIKEKLLKTRAPEQDLFLFGLIGRGKTHIMAALIRHYTGEGYGIIRIDFDGFCCRVRSTMNPASKLTEWDMMKPLIDIDILVIDDLGLRSKQETDFAYVTLYSIINKRQEKMLPTFISSNKDLDRLRESFDERIVSRLRTALIIEVKGEDKRKTMK